MEIDINEAIRILAQKAKSAMPHEALHLSQAALNLAHVLQVKKQLEQPKPA